MRKGLMRRRHCWLVGGALAFLVALWLGWAPMSRAAWANLGWLQLARAALASPEARVAWANRALTSFERAGAWGEMGRRAALGRGIALVYLGRGAEAWE
ncbi:MAG: hypothetical protein H5T69_12960, partial [Chloroflexi bacterium]|nr:hypothetical protein [Chloroflexota bacterium]